MDALLLEQLKQITPEEQALLSGKSGIDRSVYMKGDSAKWIRPFSWKKES